MFRQGIVFDKVILVLRAVFPQQGDRLDALQKVRQQLLTVSAEALMAQGLQGRQIGEEIQRQRIVMIDNWLADI